MKVKNKEKHRYLKMHQRAGSLPVFRGLPLKHRMRGSGFWGSLLKVGGKILPAIGKKILPTIGKEIKNKIVPIAIETGEKILTGKAKPKQAIKAGVKKGRSELTKLGKNALQREISKYVQGGNLLSLTRHKSGRRRR